MEHENQAVKLLTPDSRSDPDIAEIAAALRARRWAKFFEICDRHRLELEGASEVRTGGFITIYAGVQP